MLDFIRFYKIPCLRNFTDKNANMKGIAYQHCLDKQHTPVFCNVDASVANLVGAVRPASRELLSGVLSQMSPNVIRYDIR